LCFKELAFSSAKKGEQIKCPKVDCGNPVQDFEVKEFMNEDEYKDLQELVSN
jgi:hypothetical protein